MIYTSLNMKLRRWIDDKLEDRHWGAEMREVELWENERWAPGPSSPSSFGTHDDLNTAGAGSGSGIDVRTGSGSPSTTAGAGTWSKTHLRPADHAPWTRATDGWSGVGREVRWVFSLLDRCIHLSLSIAAVGMSVAVFPLFLLALLSCRS